MIALIDPTVGVILAAVIPALIGGIVALELRRLDKKNSAQHAQGAAERAAVAEKFDDLLCGIHEDIRENTLTIGRIEGKLDAHLDDHHNDRL